VQLRRKEMHRLHELILNPSHAGLSDVWDSVMPVLGCQHWAGALGIGRANDPRKQLIYQMCGVACAHGWELCLATQLARRRSCCMPLLLAASARVVASPLSRQRATDITGQSAE
jgi:hypothetical protein